MPLLVLAADLLTPPLTRGHRKIVLCFFFPAVLLLLPPPPMVIARACCASVVHLNNILLFLYFWFEKAKWFLSHTGRLSRCVQCVDFYLHTQYPNKGRRPCGFFV